MVPHECFNSMLHELLETGQSVGELTGSECLQPLSSSAYLPQGANRRPIGMKTVLPSERGKKKNEHSRKIVFEKCYTYEATSIKKKKKRKNRRRQKKRKNLKCFLDSHNASKEGTTTFSPSPFFSLLLVYNLCLSSFFLFLSLLHSSTHRNVKILFALWPLTTII